MIEQFGASYLLYQQWVPMFLPVRGKWGQFIDRSSVVTNELSPR